jgi:calreticulin
MIKIIFFLVVALVLCVNATVYFKETFDSDWESRWVAPSRTGLGKFELSSGEWSVDEEANAGLRTSQDAKFYGISASYDEFSSVGKTLVVQFSVKHEQNIDCGGGYVKVMPASIDGADFDGDSQYNIMFGPDICGSTKRVHVIFEYKGDNKLISKTIPAKTDLLTHVYTLIVNPDNTYSVEIDGTEVESGSLADDWDFFDVPRQIKDPEQSKPNDWHEEPMMEDPEDEKPEDYDDITQTIVDPEAVMPEDWDEEEDGEWEAPIIPNPEYKGPWSPKMIPDPLYKGTWEHPLIDNPDFEMDESIGQYESFGSIGIDVWQVKSGTIFDNIIITDSVEEAKAFREETFSLSDEMAVYRDFQAAEAATEAENADDEEEDEYDDEDEEDLHDEL